MNLLTAEHIGKTYADRVILQDVSFSISEGEKIGVIGINGTGKTTLLKMIAGLEKPDTGQLITTKNLHIEYLPQQPEFPENADVLEAVLHGHSPAMKLVREYEAAAAALDSHPDDPVLQKRLIGLSGKMDDAGAWKLDSEMKSILTRLGITDFCTQVSKLSGGQKKRVALAAALVNPADLLILDEPTNHIDPTAIAWLEQYLANYRGALLMVTHDRYFLERVTGVMLEIDQTRLFRYEANYDRWLELKAERVEREQASEMKRQNLMRRELAWIRRGAKARSTKQKARIDRFKSLNEQDSQLEDQNVTMASAATRLGRKTLILDKVGKGWSGQPLFHEFSYIVSRRERLGLIGPNGCGKTTLLQVIAGMLPPDSGTREIGSTVRLGFFAQENEAMDPHLRVIEYIRQTAEVVQTAEGTLTAAQMLERFLFPPALQWTPVRNLSGGEKRRLYLLHVLMLAPNILLLDEPTNDLDIMTLTVLEDYLDHFPGGVIVVSHDRYFLDRVVDRLLVFEADGLIHQYEGDFQAYQEQAGLDDTLAATQAAAAGKPQKQAAILQERTEPNRIRMKMSEKLEFASIENIISQLEYQREQLQADLADASSDYLRLQDLTAQMDRLNEQYDVAMERWLYLTNLSEQIGRQNEKP